MAKPDWEAIESAYRAGVLSLREIAAQYGNGITEGAIRKKAAKLDWVRNKKSGTQVRKSGTQKNSVRTNQSPVKSGDGEKYAEGKGDSPQETKPETVRRKVVTNHPLFQPGNQHALKHGGYGRRMLLSDAVTEDAQALTLDDELFWLRAANLTASENIGRWRVELEDAESEDAKKVLRYNISAAEKAMHRNTARIESIEYTKGNIAKMQIDSAYRHAATEKVEMEIDVMRDGGSDNAIVVHNPLPIPGR
ncbi:hypothetical protein [Candidatus Symbiopectobacterium sp.]|uniref:hypothetical protein n=1 Tax=Candidatus Symbiopectobacterium sp. TaxID=2816440 RepID=UPI0025B9205D|nr:hypothetical protein [Candidatus Symbiopectobacterium sp.]